VSFRIDDFDQLSGKTTRMNPVRVVGALTAVNQGNQASIDWAAPGTNEALEVDADPTALDFTTFESVQFRVSLGSGGFLAPDVLDFSVSVVDALGQESARVKLSDFVKLDMNGTGARKLFQTVRIPMSAFTAVDLKMAKTVRFTFDQTASGKLMLANLWLVKSRASIGVPPVAPTEDPLANALTRARSSVMSRVLAVRPDVVRVSPTKTSATITMVANAPILGNEPGYKVTVKSEVPFLPQDSLLTLVVNGKTYTASQIEDYKDLKSVSFYLNDAEYRAAKVTSAVKAAIVYGSLSNTSKVWDIKF